MRQARAVMIALRRHEDLRLVLEPPERLAVGDAIAIALKRATQSAGNLVHETTACLRGAYGEWRKPARLLGIEALEEAIGDRSSSPHPRPILLEPTVT